MDEIILRVLQIYRALSLSPPATVDFFFNTTLLYYYIMIVIFFFILFISLHGGKTWVKHDTTIELGAA